MDGAADLGSGSVVGCNACHYRSGECTCTARMAGSERREDEEEVKSGLTVSEAVSTAESVILMTDRPLGGCRCGAKLGMGSNRSVVRRLRVGSNEEWIRESDGDVARNARIRPAAVWPSLSGGKIASGIVQDPRNRVFQVQANGLQSGAGDTEARRADSQSTYVAGRVSKDSRVCLRGVAYYRR